MNNFVEPINIHKNLNSILWNDDQLKPKIRTALLRIAKKFYDFLEIKSKVTDIIISGSQANYNYTDYSDIDLHLIISYKNIKCDEPISELFNAKRKLWKEQHDIDLYGIPVELYIEDEDQPSISSKYSLIKNQWINHPLTPKIKYNKEKVEHLTLVWARLINKAIESNNLNQCKRIMKLLSKFRKLGLIKYGEFGPHNLVFKSLRNSKIIEKLNQKIYSLEDQNLSLK